MARWELMEDHYLNGYPPDLEGTEWEYKEIDRTTGRERRKRFKVPYFMDKGLIVCYEGRGQPTDVVFEGDPTPNMNPLDEEAVEISMRAREAHPHKWLHPIDGIPIQGGFSIAMQQSIEAQLAAISTKVGAGPAPVAAVGVTKEEFDALKEQLAALMAKNAELEAEPKSSRRGL